MERDFKAELDTIEAEFLKRHRDSKLSMLEEAFWFSKAAHDGQKRASGQEYFTHPAEVAKMLAVAGLDETVVCAALLHDVIEDTDVPPQEIQKLFGKEIHSIVQGLTKLGVAAFRSQKEQTTATMIKTIIASSKDLRVLVIKLFDKLHNMRTLKYLPKESQKRIAADVLTIYVPLVHKLGMHSMKYELEDLCFDVLEHDKYKKAKHEAEKARAEKAKEIRETVTQMKKLFPGERWRFEEKRKSIYSIYSKMIAQNKQMGEMHDTLILKIIVPDKYSCYEALGKLHSVFKPIPGKVKDFIAIPEYLIYRSIHTQVIGPRKRPVKVYIFSEEMDRVAKDGVVALMAENGNSNALLKHYEKLFARFGSPKVSDEVELAESLNLDFHNRAMIVFTEKGDVTNLPLGSTALDFSVFENEKNAKNATKAEVNGKVVPLWTTLNTGDRVKVFYSLIPQINLKWESFVHSEKGKRLVAKELKKRNITGSSKLVKFSIEFLDKPGVIARQTGIMAKNGLDMEIIRSSCNLESGMCSGEYYFRNFDSAKTQKAIKHLREMPETLDIRVDYVI